MLLYLDHDFTPIELKEINKAICQCLTIEDLDERVNNIKKLIEEREKIVSIFLSSHNDEDIKKFAENELVINEVITKLVLDLLETTKGDIVRFMRGRTAIKKYQ